MEEVEDSNGGLILTIPICVHSNFQKILIGKYKVHPKCPYSNLFGNVKTKPTSVFVEACLCEV